MANHPNRGARTKFSLDGCILTVTFTDEFGFPATEEFHVPMTGGYIRSPFGGKQVCAGLYSTGSTLEAEGPDDMLRIIRAEWRSRQAREKRQAKKF